MFDKILIANRGEIACRVIKTARQLGVKTVAVYSQADANALHVQLADEAIDIGAAPASESYLCGDKIIAAAQATGAQAIHPGYGFLSENGEFCRACDQHGLIFIGPPAAAIEAMGSKSAAKQIMGEAGVPLVPGYHGDDQSEQTLKASADSMGYPVLLKAVAGGGGKGMRQVWKAEEFAEALAAAKREAAASFANDDMLVEKYLVQPRHVEVQVFCDQQGNGVYLFERDCSVQRRHQKVIEEAPAPGVDNSLRAKLGEAALKAAQAISYVGAGTVEFLLDKDGSFYFMEMNTRLQVEHPVTEMITGQDLVEWQLRVAFGDSLPCAQDRLAIQGHAFEARIYAEDPDNNFLPVTGELQYLKPPTATRHVRVDTGVQQGDAVSVYYDPMIAKLIVWDRNRTRALKRMSQALADYHLGGMQTNIAFLKSICDSRPFKDAELDTGFIETHRELLFPQAIKPGFETQALIALFLHAREQQDYQQWHNAADPTSPWNQASSWRMNATPVRHYRFVVDEQEFDITVSAVGDSLKVSGGGKSARCTGHLIGTQLQAELDGHALSVNVLPNGDGFTLVNRLSVGTPLRTEFVQIKPDLGQADTQASGGLTAPMNGTVVDVLVESGSTVSEGDTLIVIEAMKMEHRIRAPKDGQVTAIFCARGDLVDGGAELLEFDASTSTETSNQ